MVHLCTKTNLTGMLLEKIDGLLEKYENIDVIFSTTEKRDIDLAERVERVNDLYDKVKNLYDKIVLVSVHANAMSDVWGNAHGTETYYYLTNMVDKEFATVIHNNLIKKTGLTNRGILPAEFYILKNPKMTACLCECAFMDNMVEAKLLLTESFRSDCAEGITNGILEYLKIGVADMKVDYKKYTANIHELKGNPLDIGVKIVNQKNNTIEEENCVNGTFFWTTDKANVKYATSILDDGKRAGVQE